MSRNTRYNALSNHFTIATGNTPPAVPSTPSQPTQQGYSHFGDMMQGEPIPQLVNNEFKSEFKMPAPYSNPNDIKVDDISDTSSIASSQDSRPSWMKSKLQGVKKISNKERRRRQNENLRRLLSPKNALMVLNEMVPTEAAHNFTVEQAPANRPFHPGSYHGAAYHPNSTGFCADFKFEGINYKGYGDNKLMARNNAAEQAIRDMIIKRLNGDETASDVPMIQLASFALHKLFSEWEMEGHKVPNLKPLSTATNESVPATPPLPKKQREVPEQAASMHPCMLLTYMRPRVEYKDIAIEGDKPQTMMFTIGVELDGVTYTGKASNKKEARKLAAAQACRALYGVTYVPATVP